MGLKVMIMTGFVLVLIVGFCIAGAVAGDAEMQDKTPFTVKIYDGISSFFELFTGAEEGAAGGDAPEDSAENPE